MVNKTILSFLCSVFIFSEMQAWEWRSKRKRKLQEDQKVATKEVEAHSDKSKTESGSGNDNFKTESEENTKIDSTQPERSTVGSTSLLEADIIREHNARNKPQRFSQSDKGNDGQSAEERQKDLLEKQKMAQERERKETLSRQMLAKGTSGDELVGKEYEIWANEKAKMSVKDYKQMRLENKKMKRVLRNLYAMQKGKKQQIGKEKNKSLPEQERKNQEMFFIYGNYEDEAGELSGDMYLKWSSLKAKTTAKQFRSLVKANRFLRNKVQHLLQSNRKLTEENNKLVITNKKLLRG